MQSAGVRPVVDARSLSVVGLVEVVSHLRRIYGEYRKLHESAARECPDLAILVDSPDFHLRVAKRLKSLGIPIAYLIAPQVWAWRPGRIRPMRETIDRLFCIFPFEEAFFTRHRIPVSYIGHPLSALVKTGLTRDEFFRKHRLPPGRPLVTLLPGSRPGEIERHLTHLIDAVGRIYHQQAATFLWATPPGLKVDTFRERIIRSPIQILEAETWDAIAYSDLALAASGTVTMEAALLGTPMVTFYRVNAVSWALGRHLVRAPFLSMVNLVAGRKIVPELMQNEMRGENLAAEALRLLSDGAARDRMRHDLSEVAARVSTHAEPLEYAAALINEQFFGKRV